MLELGQRGNGTAEGRRLLLEAARAGALPTTGQEAANLSRWQHQSAAPAQFMRW